MPSRLDGKPSRKAFPKQPPSDRRGEREMVRIPAPRAPVPKPSLPARPRKAGKGPDPSKVGEELLRLLQEGQQRSTAPLGMVKCPTCGTPIEPTRNGKVRVHSNALYAERCPSSGEPWDAFGQQPAATQRPPARGARKAAAGRAEPAKRHEGSRKAPAGKPAAAAQSGLRRAPGKAKA
ncbi:MAG TPA: hypothetical protein VM286_03900 [Candidatus Thermoplasmatota archaeon]|nr:hypothetical protein [Candidatus Thermoplasmatota archaeon]